jgi:diadenylate cyclase
VSDLFSEITYYFLSQLTWISVVDILLVTLVIYGILRLVRGTQAATLLRGMIFLVIVIALLTAFLPLQAFTWLLRTALPALLISIPVIFAPEIRRGLERIGRAGSVVQLGMRETDVQPVIQALAAAAQRLSERRHGALMVVERQVGLKEFAETGIRVEALITPELLTQIFYPNTPLHDGAVILKDDRVVATACIMPLTTNNALGQMGLRHRAALGVTEVSDAVAIVISEETGIISVVHNGRMIRRLDPERLKHMLDAFYRPRGNRSVWQTFAAPLRRRRVDDRGQAGRESTGD